MIMRCIKCRVLDDSGVTPRTGSVMCDPHEWEQIPEAIGRVLMLYARFQQIRAELDSIEKEKPDVFPIGTEIYYQHGDHLIFATVIAYGGSRLKVRGSTGKEYWLHDERVAGDMTRNWDEMPEGSNA